MSWTEWHRAYDDPASPLSVRLRVVQQRLGEALDAAVPGEVRLLSLCAGDGRDVRGVLAGHARAGDVRALLVELDPALSAAAREAAPPNVEVVTGDAADPALWSHHAPVDVLLLCGIFGNIPDDDVHATVQSAAGLCRAGGVVLWTRHRRPPDLTPAIRQWFADVRFDELFFDELDGGTSVGGNRFLGPTGPLPTERLFEFSAQ